MRRAWIGALIVVAMASALIPLASVNAQASVVLPIRVTVANSGPSAVGIVTGCFASPSLIAFDGNVHFFTVDPNCAVTILQPAPSTFVRYKFGALAYTKVTSCGSGLCPTANRTAYYQILNKYLFQAATQPTFDANLLFRVTGIIGGIPRQVVCSVITKATDTSRFCTGWSDYKQPAGFPSQPLRQRTGVNWETNNPTSFTDTAGNSTHTVTYGKHISIRLSYAMPAPKGTGFSAPVLSYKSFGASTSYTVTTRSIVTWADYASAWSVPNTLAGSGQQERWFTNLMTSGTANAPVNLRLLYYHQYNDTYRYAVSDTSNPSAPFVSYKQITSTLSRKASPMFWDWTNAGSSVSYPMFLAGSNSTTRWAVFPSSFPSAKGIVFNPTYYHQFLVTFAYSSTDSSMITNGAVLGTYSLYGRPIYPISSNGAGGIAVPTAWVDAGTNTLSFNSANAPSGNERWALLTSPDAKSVHSSTTMTESGYYHQFGLTASYSITGGGTPPSPPTLTCNALGSSSTTNLAFLPRTIWCDLGSSWTVTPALIADPGLTEKWQTTQTTNGAVSSSKTLEFSYFHQFQLGFSWTVVGGGTPAAPTVTYTQFGAQLTTPATATPNTVWVDSGSSYSYTNPTTDSNSMQRWATSPMTATLVTSSRVVDPSYYNQVAMTFAYTTNDGSTSPIGVHLVQFGAPGRVNASVPGTTGWGDVGSSYTYFNPGSGSTSTNRWVAPTTLSGSVTASARVTTEYFHQYYVTFKFTVSDLTTPTNSPSVACLQNGTTQHMVSSTMGASAWADAGSTYTYDNPSSGSPVGVRWMAATTPSGSITATTAPNPGYYHQFTVSFAYTTSDGTTISTTIPLAGYTQFGGTLTLSTAPGYGVLSKSSDWVDANTIVSYSSPIPMAIAEKFQIASSDLGSNMVIASVASGSTTANPQYYHQFAVSFSYTTNDGTSIASGTSLASYAQFGSLQTISTTTTYGQLTKQSDWANAGSAVTFVSPVPVSSNERRLIAAGDSGTHTIIATVSGTTPTASPGYFHQYLLSISYSTSDGSAPVSAPSFTALTFGISTPTALTTAVQTVWYDASSSPSAYTAGDPIPPSPTNERWKIHTPSQPDMGPILSPMTVNFVYYHQYLLTLSRSSSDGSTPTSLPAFRANQFGAQLATVLTTSAQAIWYDASTSPSAFQVDNPIPSFPTTVRWMLAPSQAPSGSVAGATTTVFLYYHQFSLTLSYSVVGGGAPTAPTFTANQFGSSFGQSLTTTPAGYWFDNGAAWTETNPLGTSTATERWQTNQGLSGTISAPQTIAFAYYHQFQNTFAMTPASPATWDAAYSEPVTGTAFGVAATGCTISLANGGGSASCSAWFDAGTTASLPASFPSSVSGTWSATPVSSNLFTVSSGGNSFVANYNRA